MATSVKDIGEMSMEEIHSEAQALIEKLHFDFEEVEWEAEKAKASLGFIEWDLHILGHLKKIH